MSVLSEGALSELQFSGTSPAISNRYEHEPLCAHEQRVHDTFSASRYMHGIGQNV
jgi:hypothetical protein